MSDARRRVSFVAPIGAALMLAATIASDGAGERFWPQWRGPHATGVSRTRQLRPSSGARRRTSGGRSRSPDVAPRRRSCGAIACFVRLRRPGWRRRALRRTQPRGDDRAARRASFHRHGDRPTDRPDRRGNGPPREERPRAPSMKDGTWASSSRHHRRPSRLRLLRIERPVRLRHGRHTALAEALRRQEDVCRGRRVGQHAGSLRRPPGRRLGSQGESFIVALDARTGEELWRTSPRRGRLLGDPARRRARGPGPGRHRPRRSGCGATTSRPATSSGRATASR